MKKVICFMSMFLFIGMATANVASADAQWTFMVYLDGDNNLESAGIDDFLEMSSVGSDLNVKIVVQFDRIDGYDSSYGDWKTCKRFYVTSGMTPTTENAIADIGEANMGDPATLTAFIDWARTEYPANRYALVLWNHGGGWREQQEALIKALEAAKTCEGKNEIERALKEIRRSNYKAVCWDDTDGGDCLYMKEVKAALNAATGDMHMIGFDACFMGMIEVAYEIKGTGASVVVGSEETEPGDGWPYDTILSDLLSHPSWTSAQLGTAIVDRYYASYGNSETQSAIDLTQMNNLASTVSNFANKMRTSWNTDQSAVQTAAQAVMDGIDTAVIHDQHGSSYPGAHGLAIYFPDNSGDFDFDYNGTVIDFAADTFWEEFLSDFYTSMGGSWIELARWNSQEFYYPEHIDLYDFCENIVKTMDDPYEENDQWSDAFDLSGYEGTWLSSIYGLGVQADEDYYRIYVTPGYERVLVDCRFTHADGDIDLKLTNSSGITLAGSTDTVDNEYIDYTVTGPGTYYIRVYHGDAGNTYDLWWDDIAPLDDPYEENDQWSDAFDLSGYEGTWLSSIYGLGVQADEDYYRIYVTPGYERVLVDCRFTHADGDIDLKLTNSSGITLAGSTDTVDNEYIDYTVTGPGTYYIRVYHGDAGNTYDLWWDDIAPSDTTPPTVAITSPTSSSTYSTSSSSLNIGGSASDNVGVTQVTWANNRGGSGTCTGTTSWSKTSITLYSGENIITVTSRDAADNTGTDTLTVTCTATATTPTVTTTTVSSITFNSASSGGNVTSNGGASVTARGVCWSTSANPTTSDNHTSDGTGTGSFTSSITGLNPNTTYHVRAYAINSEGTGYGSEETFTTTGTAPPAPTNVQATDGTYTDKVRITWSASSGAISYEVYRATSSGGTKSQIGTPSGISYDDTSASIGTTYYYWVKAKNSYGTSEFSSHDTGYRVSCTYSILPTSQSFSSSGGTGSVSVTAPSECSWTATSNDGWITIISGSSGSGDGAVDYSVSSNSSISSRTGTMTIAGLTFTVTQDVGDIDNYYVNKDDFTCGGNSPCYSNIQEAIDAAGLVSTIKVVQGFYDEDVTLNTSKTLALQGGWDSTFTTQSSNTTINSLTISSGTIVPSNLILQPVGATISLNIRFYEDFLDRRPEPGTIENVILDFIAKNIDTNGDGSCKDFISDSGHTESVRNLITHFYETILGREPESWAVEAWEHGYFNHSFFLNTDVHYVAREMGRLFFLSEEYELRNRSNAEFIDDCSQAFLNQSVSEMEQEDWICSAMEREEVVASFASSDGFAKYIDSLFH